MAMTHKSVVAVCATILLAVALYGLYSAVTAFVDGPSQAILWAYDHWSPTARDADDTGGPVAFVGAIGLASILLLWCSLALFVGWRLRWSKVDSESHGKPRT